jgi:hypothetical protein
VDSDEEGRVPLLVIDGQEVSWEKFGRMVMGFEGYHAPSTLAGGGVLIAQSAVALKRETLGRFDEDARAQSATWRNEDVEYRKDTLPPGTRSRYIDNNNGVRMHVLEAGFEDRGRPCVVLLQGFPASG